MAHDNPAMTVEQARAILDTCRLEIDTLDRNILELLNERTRVVEQIGRVKQNANLPVYEPKREDQVFANVLSHNQGPLAPDAVRRVFERIIDEMRAIQKARMEERKDAAP